MKNLLLTLALSGILAQAYSQSTMQWSKNSGAGLPYYYTDYPSIASDNGAIQVTGRQNTAYGQRLVIVSYNMNGDSLSTVSYGNDSVFRSTIIGFKFNSSGHVYILHKEKLGYYKSKIVLQKYAVNGTLAWVEQVGDIADTSYAPLSLALLNDSCPLITFQKEYDYPDSADDQIFTKRSHFLNAYNANGTLRWQRSFNKNTEIDHFFHPIFTHNNTAFLFGQNDAFVRRLLKLDINNNLTIHNNIFQTGIHNIHLTADNKLLITDYFKFAFTKADLNGSVIWSEDYGTNLPQNTFADVIYATTQDADGNIYVTGRHAGKGFPTPASSNNDILTLKYDKDGNLVWENRYQYGLNNSDIGNCIALKNGHVYVGGASQKSGVFSDNDYIILKIDSATGKAKGDYRFGGAAAGEDAVTSLVVLDNGNVALTGLSYNGSSYDWTTQLLSGVIISVPRMEMRNNIEIYPNPVSGGEFLTVNGHEVKEYTLLTSTGQLVQYGELNGTENRIRLNNDLKAGLYLLQLRNEREVTTRKIVIE
jgi:hypothetical protein